jgi:exodeoxyribonuclease V gamma subunit
VPPNSLLPATKTVPCLMPLTVTYVRRLVEIVDWAANFLSQTGDLFTPQNVVLPTVGARAWLAAELARRLGATETEGGDGIVAGVEFSYPGSLTRFVVPEAPEIDPWTVERLTFAVLDVVMQSPRLRFLSQRAGGPLLAARQIADRFDHYHFRRPGMILAWEAGQPALAPTADDETAFGRMLNASDRWQFELWRQVREAIGQPSPPAREQTATGLVPERVLIAGLQAVSFQQIELLTQLANRKASSGAACDVQLLLVHPSPALRTHWVTAAPGITLGRPPLQGELRADEGVDALVSTWLRGTCESQWLLASQGMSPTHDLAVVNDSVATPPTLLGRLKQTITHELMPQAVPFDAADDSVRIHRCHDLGRQAEVLHDAILHALREHPGLAFHEIAIVSPRIADLATHLEAVFSRRLEDKSKSIELPLQIADRGIRDISGGAELLSAILAVSGSRCAVDDMLAVATHPLVQSHFGFDDDAVEVWRRCIERTRIRWGLDGPRRGRDGLKQPELTAHTWWLGLERMLLGAAVPDGFPESVLGGVVPLRGVDTADIEALSPLISIVGIIDELDRAVAEDRPVGDWCDRLEGTLLRLAGDESDELEAALRELDALRQPATAVPVPFHDVKIILSGTLAAAVGQQPLRTGAITATSMIPLRGVPFRVICVAGFDEDAVAPRDGDSDDLVERQRILGDIDSRVDVRRSLLDCLLAAEDQLIITCTGMSVATNATLPLVTPLAEFVEFVGRHGVPAAERLGEEVSEIEVFHPRHACSRQNFVPAVVRPQTPWSHDRAACHTAGVLGALPAVVQAAEIDPPLRSLIELKPLAAFMANPLWPYVRETLAINPWWETDSATPATLPLELSKREQRELRDDFLRQRLSANPPPTLAEEWAEAVQTDGEVPIWGFGDSAVAEITGFAAAVIEQASEAGLSLQQRETEMVRLDLGEVQLAGGIERSTSDEKALLLLRPEAMTSTQFNQPKYLAITQLLMAVAAGLPLERAVVLSQHDKWFPGAVTGKGKPQKAVHQRTVRLAAEIDQREARRLLAALARLYQQAAVQPFGCFGKTAETFLTDPEEARKVFASFVSYDGNARSLEVVVHGLQPEYETVFKAADDISAFFQPFFDLTYVLPKKYIYQPR